MTDEEKRNIISKALCFGCLKPGHLSSSCKSRLQCEECGKPHPTPLHGVKPKPKPRPRRRLNYTGAPTEERNSFAPVQEKANSNANLCDSTQVTNEATTSLIVPIVLSHRDNPEVEVKVYALLDDGSDSTFIKTSVLKQLKVDGPEITLRLNTMHGNQDIAVKKIKGLIAKPLNDDARIELPKTYARDSIPSSIHQVATPETVINWPHLEPIKDYLLPLQRDMEVGILIGCNCPKALKPRDVILGGEEDPYAVKTLLGWGVLGPATPDQIHTRDEEHTCHHVVTSTNASSSRSVKFTTNPQTKEILSASDITSMFELDFCERKQTNVSLSQEDRKFLDIVENGIKHLPTGHYEMPLPIKDESFVLPNNRLMAYNRLKSLKKRFAADDTYRLRYIDFMNSMLEKKYAELVPHQSQSDAKKVWYIPHHGVYHPKKPGKLRVVFDCSACYEGDSLNNHLLQGPDLTNSLTGVLHRFRQEPIAIMCDIEAMFYQVNVPENCRDLLRFLWWEDGDTSREPKEYRMTVHLFGATSSPGCANFALKTTADDNETSLGTEAAEFVRRNFYVDDGLKSVSTVDEAFQLVSDVKEMCKRGGFNLHKFTSNSQVLLRKIPEADRADDVKNLELSNKSMERVLEVQWCTKEDAFKFVISLKDRPPTRRGILSTVSSIYDPLGFLAPVMLEGKSLLQDLCRLDITWDDPIPEDMIERWNKWKSQLPKLESISIARCYKPENFGEVTKAELHHFSDASFKGYSQCSYLRLVNNSGKIHCYLLAGKARVTPLKKLTVPRLELTAAVVSARVSEQLKRELDIEITKEVFWTDSKVVLGYIANAVRRFHIFVANRVQEIQEKSSVEQWMYVDTKNNPADEGSRGLRADQLKTSKWLSGPAFLWKNDDGQEAPIAQSYDLEDDDPELKKSVNVAGTSTEQIKSETTLEDDAKRLSSWFRVKRVIALCTKFIQRLRDAVKKAQSDLTPTEVSVSDLEWAEIKIIKAVHENHFKDEIELLKSSNSQDSRHPNQQGPLRKLNAFIDSNGLLRVGGRLRHSSLADKVKFPIILPSRSHVTTLIVRHFHNQVKHQGRSITLSEIRENGYWIVGGSRVVASAIENCVICNRLRAKVQEQKMADLPEDRLEPAPPFTNCAVDYFGPFMIKNKRTEMKRYGVLFTCLASRAVHLEVANTLETDSFINAFRRFVSRRGPVRVLRCDQGTNFVGARRELAAALAEMDQSKVKEELVKNNCDWFTFKINVPTASHMGGVWERQIRTVRNVLSAILQTNSAQLNDEALQTFMCEVEAIVNCRPLAVDNLNDPDSLKPLSPSQLLTMKTKVLMAPPGLYQSADLYSRKWWRRVQHLANEFWSRWRKEFLLSLQTCQKWTKPRREMQVNDIVIIKDENLPRSSWLLGRVECVNRSHDGRVRSAKVSIAERDRDDKGKRTSQPRCLERPIQKLVVLLKQEQNSKTG